MRWRWLAVAWSVVFACGAPAEPLYRWVDGEGRLHLGDSPPPGGTPAEQLPMPSYVAPERPADEDPYSVLNQLKRLEAYRQNLARERREKEQAERDYYLRKRELEARREPPPAPAGGAPVYVYPRPVLPVPPSHGPGRYGRRPRPPSLWEPDHPAYRAHPRPPVAFPHPSAGGGRIERP